MILFSGGFLSVELSLLSFVIRHNKGEEEKDSSSLHVNFLAETKHVLKLSCQQIGFMKI